MFSHMDGQRKTLVYPDSKVHGADMGPIWGRQDPGGPHVCPMNFPIWVSIAEDTTPLRPAINTVAQSSIANDNDKFCQD